LLKKGNPIYSRKTAKATVKTAIFFISRPVGLLRGQNEISFNEREMAQNNLN
jgi:hypothetical protein